jgi:SAM-dependent methyltransferase
MPALESSGPNAEQIHYWNDLAGPKWVAYRELLDTQIRPLGLLAMQRAAIAPGERVLDVGCGCGDTTLEIARRVGSAGTVVGADISTVMLERARQIAHDAEITHLRFDNVDAQTHRFAAASFDLIFSRFGVMFFADPRAALANLCGALRPGGRLAFVCWQELQHNPWMLVPLGAALQHLPPLAPPAPDAPGPFAFADEQRVRSLLTDAGFSDLRFEAVTETMTIGGGRLDQAVGFLLQMGPTGRLLREVGRDVLGTVAQAVRAVIEPFATADGVRMPGTVWIVTGRK